MTHNPYDAPFEQDYRNTGSSEFYYTEDLTRIPLIGLVKALRMHLWLPFAVPIAAFIRIRGMLNIPFAVQHATGGVGTSIRISPKQMDPRAIQALSPLLREFNEAGFSPLTCEQADCIGDKQQ
ncbi:MAG: hypothetical protein KDA85_18890, partial [Planctomycetaceae bacterium]|nr:hypothetical protein [Planctomycetaceae bacterium]